MGKNTKKPEDYLEASPLWDSTMMMYSTLDKKGENIKIPFSVYDSFIEELKKHKIAIERAVQDAVQDHKVSLFVVNGVQLEFGVRIFLPGVEGDVIAVRIQFDKVVTASIEAWNRFFNQEVLEQ